MNMLEGHRPDCDFSRFDRRLVWAIHGGRKVVLGGDGQWEVYDLKADPGESLNLFRAEENVFQEEISDHALEWLFAEDHIPSMDLDAATRDRLRELGYIQ